MRFSPRNWSARDIVGGDPALDFVNTASDWRTDPTDRLGGPDAFAQWALLAGLVDAAGKARLTREIRRDPQAAAATFQEAVAFRATLWRVFRAAAQGVAARRADLSHLAAWTRRAEQFSELAPAHGRYERAWTSAAPLLEQPVMAIAEAAERLLTHGSLDRLHECGGEDCGWLFLDLSKNARRRWCSMATCGNDAKVRKFRTKNKKKGAAG